MTQKPLSPTRREILYLAGVFVLLLISIILFASLNYRKFLDDTTTLLESVVTQKELQIQQWRQRHISEARENGISVNYTSLIRRIIQDEDRSAIIQVLRNFEALNESYGYGSSMVLDPEYRIVVATSENLTVEAPLFSSFVQAARTREPVLTSLINIPPYGKPGLALISPIFSQGSENSSLEGYIVYLLDAETDLYPILDLWPVPSDSAETILVQAEERQLRVLGNLRLLEKAGLSTLLPRDDTHPTVETRAAGGEKGLLRGENYAGVPTFAVARQVKDTEWFLTAQISVQEVRQPWLVILSLLLVVFVIAMIAAVLSGTALLQWRSTRFYRDQLQSEKKLRATEGKFLAFMDRMPSLVMIKDQSSRILFANHTMRFYFNSDHWIGRTPGEIFDPAQAETTLFWDRKAFDKGYVEYEESRKNRYGDTMHLLTQKFKITEDDGSVLLGQIMTDITEKGKVMRQLKELNETLEQRVAERTAQFENTSTELQSFVNTVSHDLRSPLRSLESFAELLEHQYADRLEDQGRHYLSRIRIASARMTDLINDMLALSRISTIEMHKEKVDIGNIAHAIVSEHIKKNPERVISISIKPSMIAECDIILVETLLRNLIDNAFKFSSGKQSASIDVGCTTTNVNKMGSTVYFIKDNGVGFDVAYKDSLFHPFQRLHGVDEFPGNGIGLSIAKRVIDRHGGAIWLESNAGEGTTVYFTLSPE